MPKILFFLLHHFKLLFPMFPIPNWFGLPNLNPLLEVYQEKFSPQKNKKKNNIKMFISVCFFLIELEFNNVFLTVLWENWSKNIFSLSHVYVLLFYVYDNYHNLACKIKLTTHLHKRGQNFKQDENFNWTQFLWALFSHFYVC